MKSELDELAEAIAALKTDEDVSWHTKIQMGYGPNHGGALTDGKNPSPPDECESCKMGLAHPFHAEAQIYLSDYSQGEHRQEEYPSEPVPKPTHKCTCTKDQVNWYGCKCGGI